jgi:hypothetical protein
MQKIVKEYAPQQDDGIPGVIDINTQPLNHGVPVSETGMSQTGMSQTGMSQTGMSRTYSV